MGYDKDRFEDELDESFFCYICRKVVENPTNSKTNCCEIVYCEPCIVKHLKKRTSCPQCNEPVALEDLRAMKLIDTFVSKLTIKCNFYNQGCDMTTPLGSIKNHEMYCEHNPHTLVRCEECKQDVPKSELKQHNCYEAIHKKLDSLKTEIENTREKLEEIIAEGIKTLGEKMEAMFTNVGTTNARPATSRIQVVNLVPSSESVTDDIDDDDEIVPNLDHLRRNSRMEPLVTEISRKQKLSSKLESVLLSIDRGKFCTISQYTDKGFGQIPKLSLYVQLLSSCKDLVKGSSKILCLGSGRGYFPTIVANLMNDAGSVLVVDMKQDLVDLALQNIRSGYPELLRGGRIRVELSTGGFSFNGGPFDVIFDFYTREDLPRELRSQLREGGKLATFSKKETTWTIFINNNGKLVRSD